MYEFMCILRILVFVFLIEQKWYRSYCGALPLCFLSSAGTYVKEFVHGDMGRTTPSVSSIFQCQVRDTVCVRFYVFSKRFMYSSGVSEQ